MTLYRQLEQLGDFRRGTISVNYRRCGKSNCACARKDHPGHGPQYLWNASVGGKTRARNLRWGPELEKVEEEVERYQSFLRLCQGLVEVNDQICQRRPVRTIPDATELEELKKNCRGVSPRSGKRNNSPRGPGTPGPPAKGASGPGSQRSGHPCRPAPDGGRAVGEVGEQ